MDRGLSSLAVNVPCVSALRCLRLLHRKAIIRHGDTDATVRGAAFLGRVGSGMREGLLPIDFETAANLS